MKNEIDNLIKDKNALIGDWLKKSIAKEEKGEKQQFITNTSIYRLRKDLLILLLTLRNRFSSNDPAKVFLEDGISVLRREFMTCFRDAYSLKFDDGAEEKRKLVKKLMNLGKEVEDCVKIAVDAGKEQISLVDISNLVFTFGNLLEDIDKWVRSLEPKKKSN